MDVDGGLLAVKGAHAGDHWEHHGLWVRGVWDEGDVGDWGGVDYAVDCLGIIVAWQMLVMSIGCEITSRCLGGHASLLVPVDGRVGRLGVDL